MIEPGTERAQEEQNELLNLKQSNSIEPKEQHEFEMKEMSKEQANTLKQ